MNDAETIKDDVNSQEQSHVCAWCGRDYTKKTTHVSEDVLKDYVRCMLSQSEFRKEFSLLNNTIKVGFVEPQGDISIFIDERQKSGTDIHILRDIRLLASLEYVKAIDEDTGDVVTILNRSEDERKEEPLRYAKAIKELAEMVSTSQLSMIRNCSSLFSVLCLNIVDEIVNKNFYEGVGLY